MIVEVLVGQAVVAIIDQIANLYDQIVELVRLVGEHQMSGALNYVHRNTILAQQIGDLKGRLPIHPRPRTEYERHVDVWGRRSVRVSCMTKNLMILNDTG